MQGRGLVGDEVTVVRGREVQLHVYARTSVPASFKCGGGATVEGVALGEVGVVGARQEAGAVAADLGLKEAAAIDLSGRTTTERGMGTAYPSSMLKVRSEPTVGLYMMGVADTEGALTSPSAGSQDIGAILHRTRERSAFPRHRRSGRGSLQDKHENMWVRADA